MKLRTELIPTPLQRKIDWQDKVVLCGSCFTEHIGQWMQEAWLPVISNPWGILFNPASIATKVNYDGQSILSEESIRRNISQHNGRFFSFDYHSSISGLTEEELIDKITRIEDKAREAITEADHLLITLGSAWVYERNGTIVANCHKAPASEFLRRRLSVNEIIQLWTPIVQKKHCIFTVSPVRHIGDGLHGNQISKATLLLAIEELQARYPAQVEYLPVYELLMDDLRDYRFYAEDLVHPAPIAIEAVKELLLGYAFTPRLKRYMEEADSIIRMLAHRPSDPNAPAYLEMIEKAQMKKERLINGQFQ